MTLTAVVAFARALGQPILNGTAVWFDLGAGMSHTVHIDGVEPIVLRRRTP